MSRPTAIRKAAHALLALLITVLGGHSACAQSVTNTAHASWTEGQQSYAAVSNTVAFDVLQKPVTIDTFVVAPSGGQPLSYAASLCGAVPLAVSGAQSGAARTASIQPATTLHAGDSFFFRIYLAQANLDPNVADSLTAVLTTTSGDSETITIFETGPNTGVFVGAMPTAGMPPLPTPGDCKLSIKPGDKIGIAAVLRGKVTPVAQASLTVLADPYGYVFDSEDGSPVDGAKVTMIDVATGAPAKVFAPDGVTAWPSSVYTGQQVTDSAGNTYQLPAGEYRFPLAPPGTYAIRIEPPAPYTAPSAATAAQLAGVTRADGTPLVLNPASWGGNFVLVGQQPVQVDVPLDRPPISVALTKTVSRQNAQPGDVVFYTVTATNPDKAHAKRAVTLVDVPSRLLRLRRDTVRIDGAANPAALAIAADGSTLGVDFGTIPAGASRVVTYAMAVRPDAPPGQALNRAETTDWRGLKSYASAVVQIDPDNLTGRMTIIGRITDGSCALFAPHRGIPGVRVMLEDGSFAVTDSDGRYHFDGVVPGTHVVAAMEATLPGDGRLVNCGRSTREAGSASSRFVRGQGGSLAVADFHAVLPAGWRAAPGLVAGAAGAPVTADGTPPGGETRADLSLVKGKSAPVLDAAAREDRLSAGAETDWLAQGDGPPAFLFPAADHNPRAPAVRVVIRHAGAQRAELFADGKPVEKVAFDGLKRSANGAWAVSIWRGIPLNGEVTHLVARVLNADGTLATQLIRDVHFSATAAEVRLVPEQTRLLADGRTRPVIALRVLDRQGRPVHAGISGELTLSAPYESAEAQDMMQARALAGLGRAAPHWTVKGDQGIALVELAPTMVSGALQLDFQFADGQQKRHQTLNAWVVPGDLKWTLVGLAEGSVGAKTVADAMERTGRFDSDLGQRARVAFYAKGRVLGQFLLTLAYDSAKQRDDTRLLGAIDPKAYYTVFADGSDRRFDAASRNKLYVRIESRAFYALFGDFETGFSQTQLARYQRTGTGVKAEMRVGGLHAQGFATRIAAGHRRDEIQGAGISGPYPLSSRAIIANSEQIVLEVRDRFRSEKIVSTQPLTRFVDYDVDLLAGTVMLKQPLLSRDGDLNPQFLVIDYEVDTNLASGAMNAGVRADFTTASGAVRVGATAVSDTGNGARTTLAGLDLKARVGRGTELRAEAAVSRSAGITRNAWLIEAEHHDRALDLLAYVRSMDQGYGVGQVNGAEGGRRKYGLDARLALSDNLALTTSGWIDTSLTDISRRNAVQVRMQYRTQKSEFHLGISRFDDHLSDGTNAVSTTLDAGVSQHFLNNRLEVDAATSLALGSTRSADLPTRHQLTLRYALTSQVKLTGTYEIANGQTVNARTARIGLETAPWRGARLTGGLGEQDIAEYGRRSFAAFGLAQTLNLSRQLTLDGTLEANKVLGGFSAATLVNPAQPLASGGHLGTPGTLTEDFTAATLGATWRAHRWSVTARGEWRDGEFAERQGFTFGAIRQLGEGSMVGSGFTWTRAHGIDGTASEVFNGAIALAHRPAEASFATLAKLELRSDMVAGATGGATAAAGGTALTAAGDLRSSRVIGSISTNWSPRHSLRLDNNRADDEFVQRTEIGLFGAVRYNFDRYQDTSLSGTSLLAGLDARIGLGDRVEIGGTATLRTNLSDHVTQFAFGPEVGLVPARDVLLSVGYNVTGYRDRDFGALRNTAQGLFATLRMKFDTSTFGFLGLGR